MMKFLFNMLALNAQRRLFWRFPVLFGGMMLWRWYRGSRNRQNHRGNSSAV